MQHNQLRTGALGDRTDEGEAGAYDGDKRTQKEWNTAGIVNLGLILTRLRFRYLAIKDFSRVIPLSHLPGTAFLDEW
jgi:hypothetical protein